MRYSHRMNIVPCMPAKTKKITKIIQFNFPVSQKVYDFGTQRPLHYNNKLSSKLAMGIFLDNYYRYHFCHEVKLKIHMQSQWHLQQEKIVVYCIVFFCFFLVQLIQKC